jgi:hypothetical protein
MVRMSDPYPKRKSPAEWLSDFLGSEHNNRSLAWIGSFTLSFIGRELIRWLLNILRH